MRTASAPVALRAVIVTLPPGGGTAGATNSPLASMLPALALQLTPGGSCSTLADSCTLVPASIESGAPEM